MKQIRAEQNVTGLHVFSPMKILKIYFRKRMRKHETTQNFVWLSETLGGPVFPVSFYHLFTKIL